MCTSIAMQNGEFYFGRNLDLHQNFEEQVVVTPRNYPFLFRKTKPLPRHFAIIGMASVKDGYPLYAEATNEKGLCIAGLNFPDNAYYPKDETQGAYNLSPFELIPFLLGSCDSLKSARETLKRIRLIHLPFNAQTPLTPLHWHIADKTGSIVLECTQAGLAVYENPFGVLTNNPPFPFQCDYARTYAHLSNRFTPRENTFSLGLDAVGLPGDYSSPSRFVKSAWLLNNTPKLRSEQERVAHFFHLLSAVAPVYGSVFTAKNQPHYTLYSSCINADTGIYYYRRYTDLEIRAIRLTDYALDEKELFLLP